MHEHRLALVDALDAAQALQRRATLDRFSVMRWLPPQHIWMGARDPVKLLRAGNQIVGKTTAGLGEAIGRCLGEHPTGLYCRKPPVEGWIICASWTQSVAIQTKLWEMVPRHLLDSSTKFSAKLGFSGRAVVFTNGSVLRFKTTGQNVLDLSGATLDFVIFDEPPTSPRVFQEVKSRVLKRGGIVGITMTPVNAPCEWIRELCEQGAIADYHFRAEPRWMIPVGSAEPIRLDDENRTLCDAAWIADLERSCLPHEREVVVHGGWSSSHEDRVFTAFKSTGTGAHVSPQVPTCAVDLAIGMDHGSGARFSQAAVLFAVERAVLDKRPRVWVLDEYVSEGDTEPRDDAEAILQMLDRWRLSWADLAWIYGDRAWAQVHKGTRRKSNEQLEVELARLLRLPGVGHLLPRIHNVKTGHSHVGHASTGALWLHRAMLRPGAFNVRPSCKRLIEALGKWRFEKNSDAVHVIDALRYGLDRQIHDEAKRGTAPRLRLF